MKRTVAVTFILAAYLGHQVFSQDYGDEVVKGRWDVNFVLPENKKQFQVLNVTSHKGGKIEGKLGGKPISGILAGTVLRIQAETEITFYLDGWKSPKVGVGSCKQNDGRDYPVFLSRPKVKAKGKEEAPPPPNPDLVDALTGYKLTQGKSTLSIEGVTQKGTMAGKFSSEQIKGKLEGNVLTFYFTNGNRKATVVFAKDGADWKGMMRFEFVGK